MTSVLKMTLELPDNFMDQVESVMNEEFEIAAGKWGVEVLENDRSEIVIHSLNQLRNRVIGVSNNAWNFEKTLIFNVIGGTGEINIPSTEADNSVIKLVKIRSGWSVDPDRLEESILLKDFQSHFMKELLAWARTGVFYGVASLKNFQ